MKVERIFKHLDQEAKNYFYDIYCKERSEGTSERAALQYAEDKLKEYLEKGKEDES